MEKYDQESAQKLWQGAAKLGVEGEEVEGIYGEKILNNEKSDEAARRLREQHSRSGERRGSSDSGCLSEKSEFSLFMEAMKVIDIPILGKKFTWFNSDGSKMSILDRFLLSEGFIHKGECSNLNWGPKPFKFNDCSVEHPEFLDLVKNFWAQSDVRGTKTFLIYEKMKRLKEVEDLIANGDVDPTDLNSKELLLSMKQKSKKQCGVVTLIHEKAALPKVVIASFLTLIPKKDHPQDLFDYRPICLIGSLYKILSKILANRLKKVLGKLISSCQTAFLPQRQILDGMLVLNEVIDLAKRWLKWMRACIFESSMSILVNGSPTEDFKVGRGLRQGDPLSPFLFLIVAEGLASMMNKVVDVGKFRGFKINVNLHFQLLQFADDIIIMSKLYDINVGSRLLEAGATFLACNTSTVPFKFLGIPVGANPASCCLLKSIEKIQRNFLWGGVAEERKVCWVKWNQICLPKEKGGLGVKNLELFNLALLSKWKWRFLNHDNAIWADLLRYRYGHLPSLLLSGLDITPIAHSSLWWRDIICPGRGMSDSWFKSNISCRVGNGNNIGFWPFKWYGNQAFCDLFPDLYAKEVIKNVMVSECLRGTGPVPLCRWNWSESLSENEAQQLTELQGLFDGFSLHNNNHDQWRWIPNSNGLLSVKSSYTNLLDLRQIELQDAHVLEAIQRL
ncbi:hypothetical protein TSUD_328220 [Trifolium subterraneum]|uniref:Reverse transcriptase domain-containing protein n=1 Tax=Trifolium subterraneum TaxID=3900 RepID=A0A2Z6MY58_TRISU|nr:hypothetical protein TSUD_328220 [Trifolium subterraneum]